jgi:hypothetical protein
MRCITLTGQEDRNRADDWIRTSMSRLTRSVPFLCRATSAHQGARRELNPHPSVHSRSCRNHYTTSPSNPAEGAGVEPARQLRSSGFQPDTVTHRLALPHGTQKDYPDQELNLDLFVRSE